MAAHRPDIRVDVLDSRGERRVYWSMLYMLVAVTRLIWLRLRHRPEILHLQVSENLSFPRKGVLMLIGKWMGMRVILHHHGAEFIPFFRNASAPVKAVVRSVVRNADVNIVLGDVWRRFLVEEVGLAEERIVVRFNAAADLADVEPRADADAWNFLIMANLSPRKGVGELLQAVRTLSKAGEPVRLTLGGGGQVERYRREAEELGIAPLCSFTGWLPGAEAHALFRSHGALVLPSHNEGLPMTIIEALSARVPVIATPVGSIPDLLEHEETCLFVEAGNVEAIADALRRVATDRDLRNSLTANGRKLYDERFHVGGYMSRMLELYENLRNGVRPET
jgi:glycosyltransferase involved in cell wall biosynthesis